MPESTKDAIDGWVNHGYPPGGFVTAVLCNDLNEACARADLWNREALFEIVSYLYNFCPAPCWGSPAKVKAWGARFGEER